MQDKLGCQHRNPLGSFGNIQSVPELVAGEPELAPFQPPHCIPASSPAPWQLSSWEGQAETWCEPWLVLKVITDVPCD